MNTPIKVVIQIPCLDEEATLPLTVADLPRELDGVDLIETLVIDDGSADGTVEVARKIGVDHIVRHTNRKGLARAFCTGIDACLKLGADIIVNTDADNQYAAGDISRLIKPILDGKADIVVGTRDTQNLPEFSFTKKKLQKLGSLVVRRFSGANVPDAVSGFRALSRDAALKMNIISPFSYTIEMLIQAGKKHLAIEAVPIRTNPAHRESRLAASQAAFIKASAITMLRMYAMYQPLRVFCY